MKKCDKDFLELYLNSTILIGSNNKIICDDSGYIIYTSENISNKYLVGDKLELTKLPHNFDKKLEYSPLTGSLLMIVYDLGKKSVIANYQPLENKENSLFSLEQCKQQLTNLLNYDEADRDFLALYITSYQHAFHGYTTGRISVHLNHSTLTYGNEFRKDFKKIEKIISPISGKILGQIAY